MGIDTQPLGLVGTHMPRVLKFAISPQLSEGTRIDRVAEVSVVTNRPDAFEPPGSGDAGKGKGTPSPPLLSTRVGQGDGQVIVELEGELDVSTAPQLHEVLVAAVSEEGSDAVVLDLSGLNFLDSTGLSLLVSTDKRVKSLGRVLILRSAQPIVRRLLEVTGLNDVFRIEQ